MAGLYLFFFFVFVHLSTCPVGIALTTKLSELTAVVVCPVLFVADLFCLCLRWLPHPEPPLASPAPSSGSAMADPADDDEYDVKDEELVDFEGSDYGFESGDEAAADPEEQAPPPSNPAPASGGDTIDPEADAVVVPPSPAAAVVVVVVDDLPPKHKSLPPKPDLEDGELDDAAMVIILSLLRVFPPPPPPGSHPPCPPLSSLFFSWLGFPTLSHWMIAVTLTGCNFRMEEEAPL